MSSDERMPIRTASAFLIALAMCSTLSAQQSHQMSLAAPFTSISSARRFEPLVMIPDSARQKVGY